MALNSTDDRLICVTCGTQFDVPVEQPLKGCKICDDPRQYVPATGQEWTSFEALRGQYTNAIKPLKEGSGIWHIETEPKAAIGQRCFLITTPNGNVLWDCIMYLDQDTVDFIKGKGGLKAIVISHPHYYTTHLLWAKVFDCQVYIAAEDEGWCVTRDTEGRRALVHDQVEHIVPGIDAIKLGGHFPGSLVLRYLPAGSSSADAHLFIADTFMVVKSGLYHVNRPPGTTSFTFLWSYPNMIPLPPTELHKMWLVLRQFSYGSVHGAFADQDIWDKDVPKRVLDSMKIQCRHMGYGANDAAIFAEVPY